MVGVEDGDRIHGKVRRDLGFRGCGFRGHGCRDRQGKKDRLQIMLLLLHSQINI